MTLSISAILFLTSIYWLKKLNWVRKVWDNLHVRAFAVFCFFCFFHDRLVIEEMTNLRLSEWGIWDFQSQLFEGTKCHKHSFMLFNKLWSQPSSLWKYSLYSLVILMTFKLSWLLHCCYFQKVGCPIFFQWVPTTTTKPVFVNQLADKHGTGNLLRLNISSLHPSILSYNIHSKNTWLMHWY